MPDHSEYSITNISYLSQFFSSLWASKITVKYGKQGEYWPYCT